MHFFFFRRQDKLAVHVLVFWVNHIIIIIEPLPDDENFRQGNDFGIWLSSKSFTRFFDELFNSHFKNSTDREKKIKSILK